MPKKPAQEINITRLEGLLNLFDTLNSQIKMEVEEADELKAEIKKLIKQFGTPEGTGFVFTNAAGVKASLSIRENEAFDTTKAMDVMNALPAKLASQYTTVTITKDLFYQALADGAITPEDAKKCVTLKPIEALSVKKEETP